MADNLPKLQSSAGFKSPATGNFTNLVYGFIILIIFIIALGGGGGKTFLNIFSFMKQVPGWIWALLILIFIFGRWGRK